MLDLLLLYLSLSLVCFPSSHNLFLLILHPNFSLNHQGLPKKCLSKPILKSRRSASALFPLLRRLPGAWSISQTLQERPQQGQFPGHLSKRTVLYFASISEWVIWNTALRFSWGIFSRKSDNCLNLKGVTVTLHKFPFDSKKSALYLPFHKVWFLFSV